jgi:uncharacterized protein (TIGR03435 family)
MWQKTARRNDKEAVGELVAGYRRYFRKDENMNMRALSVSAICSAMILAVAFNAKPVRAQASTSTPAFEVALIKAGDAGAMAEKRRRGLPVMRGCHATDSEGSSDPLSSTAVPEGRCVFEFIPLRGLITLAFYLEPYQLTDTPDWVNSNSAAYYVEAKAEGRATLEQFHQMLQGLLTDRVKLKLHRETRDMAGLALVVAKNGPKLRQAAADEDPLFIVRPFQPPVSQMTAHHISMAVLAKQLTDMSMGADRGPTVDKTGLPGFYDFQVTWQMEGRIGTEMAERVGPTLPVAFEEQLGIRVESQKHVPVELVILDHIEKPTLD